MQSKEALAFIAVATLAGAALVGSGVLLDRMFARHAAEGVALAQTVSARGVVNWRELTASGHRVGPADAPVVILEFGDFQCPACGRFERETLHAIRREFPTSVAVVFRHWPLAMHPLAMTAANASECAGRQGRFAEYSALLFAEQAAIGKKSFVQFAAESSVPDTGLFAACMASGETQSSVDADVKAATTVGAKGTPAIILNGKVLPVPPGPAELAAYVTAAIHQLK